MISNLVVSLPEVYQPVFGYPELSGRVSRPCHDRLQKITAVYDALLALLGRPLKVLDLGCAQGYFSLSLAERGATVHGVDFLDKNIELCKALATEHSDLQVSFEIGRVEDVISSLEPEQYDLVLGLSVFHHVVYEKGVEEVRRLLANAARHCGVLLIEVALHDEPLYWAAAQPKDPRFLFESIAFVHEVARHGTHLAPIPRPLYVASNRYWVLDGRAGQFDTWSADPHVLARGTHEGSRRYFFGANTIAKIYRFDHPRGPHNRREANREKDFLANVPAGVLAPACLALGENATEGWIALERLPGRLLIDLLREGADVDRRRVLLEVLDQCAALESGGLYHDDVRTWNVLVADDGAAHLIDYGSISSKAEDCVWPRNPFLAFFIFVREVATGVVDDPDPLRTISISPFGLPEPYRAWAISLWQRPMAEWSFGLMREIMLKAAEGALDGPPQQPLEIWMAAVEEAMQAQKLFANHLRQQIGAGKAENQQVLQSVVESHARELGVLGRSIALLEQLFQDKQTHCEILEKQLAWEQEKIRRAEGRHGELEAKLREQAQCVAVAEAAAEGFRLRALSEEARGCDLEGRLESCLRRAVAAEAHAAEQEYRAGLAEAFIEDLELRVVEAETRAVSFEAHVADADAAAGDGASSTRASDIQRDELKRRVVSALMQLHELEQRAISAESRVGELEYAIFEAENKADELKRSAATASAEIEVLQSRAQFAEAQLLEVRAQLSAANRLCDLSVQRTADVEAALRIANERLASTERKRQDEESEINAVRAECASAQARAAAWQLEADRWHQRVVNMHSSTSWRVTRPLRLAKRLATNDPQLRESVARRVKKLVKPSVLRAMNYVLSRPKLKAPVAAVLKRGSPFVYQNLRLLSHRREVAVEEIMPVPMPADTQPVPAGKRVAVLVPASASGMIGGAERFYSGLMKALMSHGCEAEIVALPVDESSFDAIRNGYSAFEELDLDHFDLVISTKAPTYVVRHRNHVLYLVHTVRVFYDMFDEVFPNADATLRAQREWVHHRDTEAFASIKHRFSIGAEVSRRLREWNNCDAEILHPPIDVDGLFDKGIGDYFFMPGRLHTWKRVDLAIRAIRKSALPLRLVISGEGEAEASLRELAGNDSRIEFLGRVDDDALRKLYAGALAIPFLPLREDYGYVTLEAFASGKPVVTCVDSGEPTVFVDDGISGFVCQPDPQALCDAFERLWTDRQLAARMGRSGRERIASINWSSVVGKLLQAGFPESVSSTCSSVAPLKVAVLDMQPITPAVGGGRLRLLGLYHALGKNIDVRYVGTYDWPGESYRRHKITPTLEETNVPLSAAHHEAAAAAARDAAGKTVIDMLFHRQAHLSDDYLEEAFRAVEWADVVVFSHPWVAPLVADSQLVGKVVVYDSQNVERSLRAQLLDVNNPFERSVLDEVECAERIAGDRADLILACSEDDANEFTCYYGWNRADIAVVPNGVFADTLKPASQDEKLVARRRLGVAAEEIVAFFIGSDYAPNVEAAEIIARRVAPACRDVTFVVAGGVCEKIGLRWTGNLRAIGFVDDEHRKLWLHAADFALNPMCSGSGTNIKMFDFMAAGLPVVTTATGARGIASASSPGLRIVDVEQMASTIHSLIKDQSSLRAGGAANRALVEDRFSWEQISPALGQRLKSAWTRKEGMRLLSDGAGGHRVERLAHLTTMGLKCGIGEYTRKIVDIFETAGIKSLVLSCDSALEKSVGPASGPDFRIAWFFDNESWGNSSIKDDTIAQLVDWGAQGVLIQYHPGFFSPAKLETFIAQCLAAKVRAAVVVHNFTPACVEVFGNLNKWGVPIFSHRKTEINEARSSGVVLEFVPIGVDVREMEGPRSIAGRDFAAAPPKIVTNGFLRAHKGVRVLIDALPIVHRSFPGATVRVQCPLYSSEDSGAEFVACQAHVDAAGLGDYVQIDTRFLPKSDLLRELATADVAVLPYLISDEGGSASATDAIAVGLPLIVSTAEIFDGVRDVCETVEPTPEAVAGAIVKVLGNLFMYDALATSSFRYARENSWKFVAGSYLIAFCDS